MRVVLPFKLVGQKLVKGRDFPKSVADGSKDSVVIKVGGIPDGCIAKGYFKLSWESNTTYDLTFDGDELVVDEYIVTLPAHANNKYIDYKFSFSVAIWEGDIERLTTSPVEIVVEKSNYSDTTTNTPDIPESQYDALATIASEAKEAANLAGSNAAMVNERITHVIEPRIGDVEDRVRSLEESGTGGGDGGGGGSVIVDTVYNPESPNAQSGLAVAEALEGVPIKYIESPDADGNIVCFRDLPSGTYSLKGTFMPCFETEDIVEIGEHPFFANIVRGKQAGTGVNESHIQIYNPNGNVLRYYICTNFAYTSQTIYFNELTSRQVVEDMIAEAGGGIIVDDELDANSTNPVQNTVVASHFTNVVGRINIITNTANDALTAANAAGQTAAVVRDRVEMAVVPQLEALETAIANQRTVNARDYGAVGDGVTDDTEAIQAALHYAEDNELPLYIPAGNYLVSKTISTYTRDTEGEHPSAALNIYGSGMSTTFTTTEDFDGDYVFNVDAAKIQPRMLWVHDFAIDLNADVSGIYFNEIGMKSVIENLWITFNYLKQETDTKVREGIYCHQATVTTFQRIKVKGNILGLDGKRPMNCGIVVNFMHSTKIIDCDVIFCGWGIYLSGGSNNLIENCRIDENEYGVYQNSSADVEVDTRAYAVGEIPDSFIGTFGNLTIRKNRFEGNNQVAIYLIAFSTGELNYMYNAQITIADNNFTGLGKGTATWQDDREVFRCAMRFGRCKGIAIIGNKFKGMPYETAKVDITDADGNVVSYNTANQNIGLATHIEDLTLRDNVAITWPLWTDDTNYTVVKTNTKVSSDIVSQLNYINDIEANQTTRQDISVRRNKPDVIRTSGTASASRSNVIYVEDGVTVNAVSVESSADLTCNQEVTFIARGNATIKCTNTLVLNGGVDFAMGLYDTLTVVCLYHNNDRRWVEKSRSVNRAT